MKHYHLIRQDMTDANPPPPLQDLGVVPTREAALQQVRAHAQRARETGWHVACARRPEHVLYRGLACTPADPTRGTSYTVHVYPCTCPGGPLTPLPDPCDYTPHPRLPRTLCPALRAAVRAHQGLSPVQAVLPVAGLLADVEDYYYMPYRHAKHPVISYIRAVAPALTSVAIPSHYCTYYVVRDLAVKRAPYDPLAAWRVVRRWLGYYCGCAPCTLAAIVIATETLVRLMHLHLPDALAVIRTRRQQDHVDVRAGYGRQLAAVFRAGAPGDA
jgi:hypothetical protein